MRWCLLEGCSHAKTKQRAAQERTSSHASREGFKLADLQRSQDAHQIRLDETCVGKFLRLQYLEGFSRNRRLDLQLHWQQQFETFLTLNGSLGKQVRTYCNLASFRHGRRRKNKSCWVCSRNEVFSFSVYQEEQASQVIELLSSSYDKLGKQGGRR